MKNKYAKYGKYFLEGNQVRVIARKDDRLVADINAEIISVKKDLVWFEVLGEGLSRQVVTAIIKSGASLSGSTGWGLFRSNGIVEEAKENGEICIRVSGEIDEQQRREYFRLDVEIPLKFSVPEDQHATSVSVKWMEARKKHGSSPAPVMAPYGNGYRVVKWRGGEDLLPQSVNLSAGGFKFKTLEYIEPGTKILSDVFLPLAPTCAISTIAEVVRCKEMQLSWEKGTSYTTAVKFTSIDEKDRESIITYVFGEQRSQLQANRERRS
jgi:c-di-GMP-binding flagellar brake protein YcgR